MVEAATRYPSRRSSPWILTTAQRRFSRASRTINATRSSGIGGRPGGLGWRHFAAAMRRCQRSNVPGVTIRHVRSAFGKTRASAASTARSVQDKCGLGIRPVQHRDLVPQHEYLRVPGRGRPRQQREPGHHGHQQPVSQRNAHER